MSPHCEPELEDIKPLAHHVASPYQVWSQKVQQQRRYHSDEHSLEFWTFPVTFTLTTTEQSNLFTRQSTLWWCTTKTSCKRIASSDNILKSKIMVIFSFTVTLILKTANQSFWKTIWLIMMHHHAKFGYTKQFSNSEKIIWTIIHWHCKMLLWPWPSTQNPNFSIRHSG